MFSDIFFDFNVAFRNKKRIFLPYFYFLMFILNTHPISGINYNILININYKNASCTFFLDVVCCKKVFEAF